MTDTTANLRRLALEDADALDRTAEDADENQWPDWGATMRQSAERIRILAAQPSAGAQGEARFADCREDGSHPNCHRCYRGEVPNMSCDDCSWFEMGAVSGGANEHGMFGWIEMIEHTKDGEQVRHEYVRTDSPLYATPAQPDTGDVAALREALEWLEWARPKAVSAMEDHRCLRVKAGHDMKGTYRSGTTYVGLYQSEVDEIEGSADFIVNLRNRVAALSKPNAPGRGG